MPFATMDQERYFLRSAAAFVRGRAVQGESFGLLPELVSEPLDSLSISDWESILEIGLAAGIKLHKFKRTMGLARVRKVFGMLHTIAPNHLLDIGSGRGTFLWPLIDEFPSLPVTVVEANPRRARDLEAARLGGISQLSVFEADATRLPFFDRQFDVVTILEVLEHIPKPQLAILEIARVASRSILLSVPSQPDDNPEHLHLFNRELLTQMFLAAGISRLNFDFILNHILLVANLPQSD